MQKPWVAKRESVQNLNVTPRTPPPPPPSSSTYTPQPTLSVAKDDLQGSITPETISKIKLTSPPSTNLLLRSVSALENEFWSNDGEQRKPGLLVLAVNHIYKDVYRLPLSLN